MSFEIAPTKAFNCPNCNALLDWITKRRQLRDSDAYSVCIYCQATFVPDRAGGYRGLTVSEWIALKRDNRITYDAILNAVAYFREHPVSCAHKHMLDEIASAFDDS